MGELAAWLSPIVDGEPPEGVAVPHSEHPLDYLLGVLRTHADREQAFALAEAAGELFVRWVAAHAEDLHPSKRQLDRLSSILAILERVPAPARAATSLFWFCQAAALPSAGPDGPDVRRQALFALALSPPSERHIDDLTDLFRAEMDNPEYAVAGFTGLCRLRLGSAVEQVPQLLSTLKRTSLPPDEALWGLFRVLEGAPDLAARLRRVVDERGMTEELAEVLRDDLQAPQRFPAAWSAFDAAGARPGRCDDGPADGFRPLAAPSPEVHERVNAALGRLAGRSAELVAGGAAA